MRNQLLAWETNFIPRITLNNMQTIGATTMSISFGKQLDLTYPIEIAVNHLGKYVVLFHAQLKIDKRGKKKKS